MMTFNARGFHVVVTGGRNFNDCSAVFGALDALDALLEVNGGHLGAVNHGDATGADRLAAEWARRRGHGCIPWPADWQAHGRAAGPIRNQAMLDGVRPDFVVAFPGGRGTADLTARAERMGIPVVRIRPTAPPHDDGRDDDRHEPAHEGGDDGEVAP